MSACRAVVVVVVLVLAWSFPAAADPERPAASGIAGEDDQLYSCKNGKGPVAVTFKPETEIKDLITWAMSFTCKSFVLDPRIVLTGKKVTLIVPTKQTPAEAYRLFLAALSTIGLTVVPKGSLLRIVESNVARRDSVPLLRKGMPDNIDQIVRYVYRPTYAQVDTIKNAFTALKSDAGELQTAGALVVITDYATNVRDMMSIGKLIDVPGGTDGVYTIPIRHADASKLAPKLESLLGVAGSAPGAARPAGAAGAAPAAPPAEVASAVPSKIMVDERTNTLVVAASEAAYQRVRAIVERLDISLEIEGGATFHVYPLGHAIAEELAATLNQAITGAAPSARPTAGGAPTGPPRPAPTPPVPTTDGGTALDGPVRVIGEKATNSLIVMSSGRDFLAIRDMIRQLDLPRRQVYIEATILEVSVETGRTLGLSGHGGAQTESGALKFGGLQLPGASTVTEDALKASLAGAQGLIGGVIGPMINIGLGTSIPSYAVLFQALATQSNSNVLSAPSIIAVDNEEAKYSVGTRLYIPKRTTSQFGESVVPEPVDVELELKIKPHISQDESILLEIKHDAEEIIGQGQFGPTTSTRNFDTRVVVRDQQTVVIGGLMQERQTYEQSQVPFLGDIPILGYLFKYTKKGKRKTNLLVMLTPYIIKSQLDLQMLRERKTRQANEFTGSLESLRSMRYMPSMDYRRKRGLVEEINRVVLDIDTDLAARKALREPSSVKPGAIEYAPVDPER